MSSSFLSRASVVSVAQSCPTLGDPMDCSPPGFIAWCLHGVALLCSRPVGEGQETCAQQALRFFLVGACLWLKQRSHQSLHGARLVHRTLSSWERLPLKCGHRRGACWKGWGMLVPWGEREKVRPCPGPPDWRLRCRFCPVTLLHLKSPLCEL